MATGGRRGLRLVVEPGDFAVARGPAGAEPPPCPESELFWSVTRTTAETSLVCREELAPTEWTVEGGWRLLRVVGPLDFALVGILSSLTAPLARRRISVFSLSTFDTDHLLVRGARLAEAVEALIETGYEVEEREESAG